MNDERKDSDIQKTWFSNTLRQEKERKKSFHPSMQGVGLEPIEIEKFDEFGEKERGVFAGFEQVKIKDIPMTLLDKWRSAASRGRLYDSYVHYTEQLFKAGGIDETAYKALLKFAPELKKAGHYLEQQKLLEDVIVPYIGRMGLKEI